MPRLSMYAYILSYISFLLIDAPNNKKSIKCKVCLSPRILQCPLSTSFSDYAITHNLTPFISMQNHHSLLYREEEREMYPTLKVRSPSYYLPASSYFPLPLHLSRIDLLISIYMVMCRCITTY